MGLALEAVNVDFSYRNRPVLHNVDLRIDKGEFVCMVGPNGAGKSTLLRLISGILSPDAGEIRLQERVLSRVSRREIARILALVPQETMIHFPFTVGEFVLMGRHPYTGFSPFDSAQDRTAAESAMRITDTLGFRDRPATALSGGERQRVVLAAALAQEPDVLLLDEPTSSLDLKYQVEMYGILEELNRKRGLTVLAVTHDLNLAALYARRLVLLAGGRIVRDGEPGEILMPDVIREFYGVEVLAGTNRSTGSPFVLPTGQRSGS